MRERCVYLWIAIAVLQGAMQGSYGMMSPEDAAFERSCATPKAHLTQQIKTLTGQIQELRKENQDSQEIQKQLKILQEDLEKAQTARRESHDRHLQDENLSRQQLKELQAQAEKAIQNVDQNQNVVDRELESCLKKINQMLEEEGEKPVENLKEGLDKLDAILGGWTQIEEEEGKEKESSPMNKEKETPKKGYFSW